MATCGEDADVGFVQIVEDLHVGHHVRIARNIDRMALSLDDEAAFGACDAWPVGAGEGRGMQGVDHRDLDPVQIDGATLVETHGLDLLMLGPVAHQVVLTDHGHAMLARKIQNIGDMVKMAMGQQDVGRALGGGGVLIRVQHRVACQPGVQQQDLACDLEPERAVAQPDDLHVVPPWVFAGQSLAWRSGLTRAGVRAACVACVFEER